MWSKVYVVHELGHFGNEVITMKIANNRKQDKFCFSRLCQKRRRAVESLAIKRLGYENVRSCG